MALVFQNAMTAEERFGKIELPESTPAKPQQGRIADMADSATAGFYNATGGILDMVGAKGFAKNFYGWADENIQEMSDRGQQAISKNIIQKDELGDWSLGEGATDFDTWLLGFANMAGQFAPTMIPGAGAASLATKAGLGALGVNAARIGGYAAAGGSAATGQAMEEARQEVVAMPDGVLMQSDRFKRLIGEVDKEQPGLDDDSLWDAAKARLADQVAADVQTDPKVLIANYAASAIGDPIIGRALAGARIAKGALGSVAKGFAVEGTTEAAQAGVTKYGVNEALQPIDGRDSMQGVDVAAANEGIMGGLFGGVIGGTGGVINRDTSPAFDQPQPADSGSVIAPSGQPVQPDPSMNLPPQVEQALSQGAQIDEAISQIKDPDADVIRQSNQGLAETIDAVAQGSARKQIELNAVLNNLKEAPIAQPAIPQNENIPSPATVETDGASQSQGVPADEGRVEPRLTGFDRPAPTTSEPIQFVPENMASDSSTSKPSNTLTQPEVALAQPVQVKGNGIPWPSAEDAVRSRTARVAKKAGQKVEAVQFADGWGWRVKEVQPEPQANQVGDTDVVESSQAPQIQMPELQPAPSIEAAPVQMKKSGDPFKSEKEMKISASYKAAAATGAELETVPVDGGFGFRVKNSDQAAMMQSPEADTAPQAAQEVQARPAIQNVELFPQRAEILAAIASQSPDLTPRADIEAGPAELSVSQNGSDSADTLAEPAPTVQEVSDTPQMDSAGYVVESDANSVKVYGDPAAIRETLRSQGVNFEGAEIDGGLSFGKKMEGRIRSVLEAEQVDIGSEGIKFSKTVNKPDADQYRAELSKSLKSLRSNPEPIRMGKTPDVMVRFGAPKLDLYIRKDTVVKATNKVKADHDVPMNVIEQLPELMSDPIAVLDDSGEFKGQVLIVDAVTESGKAVAVAVHIDVSQGRAQINRVSSAYGRNSYRRMKLLYLNKDKNPDLVRLIGSQLPLSGSPDRGSEQNVLTKEDLVKENPDIQFNRENTIESKPAKGVNPKLAEQLVASIMKRLNGAAGIKVVVLESQAEAEKLWQMSLAGDLVRGAYNRATNTAYVIAENIKSMDELREVVAHEVIGHGGLQNVISKADYKTFIERLKQTRNNRAFAEQWAQIDNDYEGFSENDKAEELFAYFVQNKPVTGPVRLWFNALKRWLHKALVSVGLAKAGDPDVEAMQDMLESIMLGFKYSKKITARQSQGMAYSSTDVTQTTAFKEWFGDSKVVDNDGKPLVVYHGTGATFDRFSKDQLGSFTGADSAKGGFFFTNSKSLANQFRTEAQRLNTPYKSIEAEINKLTNEQFAQLAKDAGGAYYYDLPYGNPADNIDEFNEARSDVTQRMIERLEEDDRTSFVDDRSGIDEVIKRFIGSDLFDSGVTMQLYLSIQNPLVLELEKDSYFQEDLITSAIEKAKSNGMDGVIIRGMLDSAAASDKGHTEVLSDIYIAFDPEQIKSATGNNGDFDPNNPDIRFSKSRTAEALAGTVTDLVGRKRLDPNDPYAVENRRLREQDRTLWDKAKQVFMRNFAPGGMLPRSIFDAKISRDGEIESGEMTIKHLIFALERAVQKDSGKNVDNQSDEFINMMADALAGKVNDKLGNETKAALVAMRQYIDALSGDYLSVIQTKIDELTERIKQDDKYTDKVQALNEIELYEKIKGNMGVYVNRSYRAFDDPKWFQKVPVDVINRAREYLRGQYKAQGDDQTEANRKAEVTLNKILKTDTAYDSMASFIAESKLGAKDLSTLIARKDISPEIRELLGEYKDPRMNFAKTATKMARLVWNSRFLDKVKADGVGVFFFDEESRPAEATVQIAGDQSKTYEPLNGYWTFPEVAEALQDSLGAEKMEAWYEAAVKLTSMVKYGKTVLSPTTAMRNWQSAMFFAVANGHFDFKHMKKSLAAFREQVSQSATGDDLAYLKKLKKLGVVYDAPYAGEMMQLLSDSKIDEWLEGRKGKVFGTARQINNLAQGFYSFGDDFWKIIGYENEKANFISAGLSEAEAEKMAAERIRNTYPTYSMVGRAIKKLARFPLMGTFVSFPAEIIRTTANMLRYAAQDMKSDNPKIRAMARKRLIGMALVSGLFYALSAMTAAMLGVDDEEEEAIRDVGPSWQKNSTFLFYGRDDKGKLQYFDISFLDPYGYFKRPITALLRDQPWEDAAASGAADMLSPFFGADITAGTFFQVFANKKQSGGQVYNEYADGTDQLVSIADHIWTGLRPGFVNNAMGIFNAAAGNRREGSGKEYDLGDEMMALMGWRASSLDAPTALYYRSFDFADQLQAANSTLNKVLRSDNSVDDDDIADAKEEAQRQYDDAFKQMQRIVQSGRNAGMTKEQVYRTLKLSGVSSRNISGLVNGNIPPMQAATLQTQVKAVAKAREIRGDEQASEVLRRFQIARQLQ